MKKPNPWTTGTLVLSGLLTAGLLALPVTAVASSAGDAKFAKRDDDGSELVLVVSDDDDGDDALQKLGQTRTRTQAQTRTRTRTQGQTRTRSRTRTGANSGRDNSRGGPRVDWTQDGPGAKKRDWSRNHTNDRSRHNTRGR